MAEQRAKPEKVADLAQRLERALEAGSRAPDMRPQPKSYVEWAGVWLCLAVLALLGLVVVGLLLYPMLAAPSLESFGTPATAESLGLWREASDVSFQRATSLLDQVAIKMLLPLLTLLLGYVFGATVGHRAAAEGNG